MRNFDFGFKSYRKNNNCGDGKNKQTPRPQGDRRHVHRPSLGKPTMRQTLMVNESRLFHVTTDRKKLFLLFLTLMRIMFFYFYFFLYFSLPHES